jgi:hypothetical protein
VAQRREELKNLLPRGKELLIRTTEDRIKEWKKLKTNNKLRTYDEVLLHLFQKAGQGVVIKFQKCQHFSEYPSNPNYVQCLKNGRGRIKRREDCRACNHYAEIEVPLAELSYIKIEVEEWEKRKRQIKAEIREGETIKKLQSQVQELLVVKERNLYLEDEIKKAREPTALSESASYRNSHQDLSEDHQNQRPPRSVENLVQEIEKKEASKATTPTQAKLSRQTYGSPSTIKTKIEPTFTRTIEREKTTEREKIVEVEDGRNLEIWCALNPQWIALSFCRKDCKEIIDCPFLSEINAGKIPQNAETRRLV